MVNPRSPIRSPISTVPSDVAASASPIPTEAGPTKYKCVFLGDAFCGKTAIMQRVIEDQFSREYTPTIGVDFVSKTMQIRNNKLAGKQQLERDDLKPPAESQELSNASAVSPKPPTKSSNKTNDLSQVRLQLWDTSGQDRFQSSLPSYVRGSHIAVIVFDITKKQQFEEIPKWISRVRSITPASVVWLVASKVDLPIQQHTVTWGEMERLALTYRLQFYTQCSSKADYNIRQLFHIMTLQLVVLASIPKNHLLPAFSPTDIQKEMEKHQQEKEESESSQFEDGLMEAIASAMGGLGFDFDD